MSPTEIARVCHEVNRAYCASLGDISQPAWESAPQWQKDSVLAGVRFHQEHPDSKPSDSHESWVREKAAAGWKYGPTKDPERKEHPCFVPYEQLPREQQAKDFLFLAVVRALAAPPSYGVACVDGVAMGVANPTATPAIPESL